MKNLRRVLDLHHKKPLRIAILILTTLLITVASALVYASMVYEKVLGVGKTSGAATGSASTGSTGVSFTPVTIIMLAAPALAVGLNMFGLLRGGSRKISKAPSGGELSPTGPVSMPPEEPGIGMPLRVPSSHGEEWEESPTKKESSMSSG